MKEKTKVCKRCVMDNINTNITFDNKGICNFCTTALEQKKKVWKNNFEGEKELDVIINNIKIKNKNKKYDCVLGISGGIDSSYVAYYLQKYNLRILGVHIDGGWNTEISEKNIKLLCNKLNIDLVTIKIDEKEMYDLQKAYFLSEVINQDIPQDQVFFAVLYRYALKNKIKYFLSGGNFSSESILPTDWGFNAMDGKNMKDIHKKYGKVKLKEVKPLSFFEIYISIPYIHKLRKIRPLNYINYDKEKAIKEIHEKIGFEYYGGKHCESVFTRLYQGYILPKKFGVNKSKAHLSSLIVAEQLSRKEALKMLDNNNYIGSIQNEKDIEDFISKIDITREKFDEIIDNNFIRNHREFKNYEAIFNFFDKLKEKVKKWKKQ